MKVNIKQKFKNAIIFNKTRIANVNMQNYEVNSKYELIENSPKKKD